jgi:UTP--glucose-1-phosphate uridylyltransferase
MATSITTAVIPAAGMGTRMLPAAKAIPKELLPVIDRPVLQHVVEECAAAGIKRVIIVSSRAKPAIEKHFRPDPVLDASLAASGKLTLLKPLNDLLASVQIEFAYQDQPRGLGHAVLAARATLAADEPVACLLGDTIFLPDRPDFPLPAPQLAADFQALGGDAAVLGLQEVSPDRVSRYGIVEGREISPGLWHLDRLIEKPAPGQTQSRLAIAARYILPAGIWKGLEELSARVKPPAEVQLTDAIAGLLATGRVYGRVLASGRLDIGNPTDWLVANVRLAMRDPKLAAAVAAAK